MGSGRRFRGVARFGACPHLILLGCFAGTHQIAQEATRQDYLHEVEHMRERVARLEQAITEAVKLASPALQQVINDLQALRGIADISAGCDHCGRVGPGVPI
jgi:transposase